MWCQKEPLLINRGQMCRTTLHELPKPEAHPETMTLRKRYLLIGP